MYSILICWVFLFLIRCPFVFSSGIPGADIPKHIKTGYNLAIPTHRDHLEEYVDVARAKLTPSLRNLVPSELILASGFSTGDQDLSDMAGCYIRLGQSLRQYEFLENRRRFASIAFLYAGETYAKLAFALRYERMHVDMNEIRVNFLVSAAQCYYWAFCNQSDLHKKQKEKKLSIDYLSYARNDANLLTAENKDFWLRNIAREYAKLS